MARAEEGGVIAIQPFEGIPEAHVKECKEAIERYYHFKVEVLPVERLPEMAFINVKSPRYRADKLLAYLHTKQKAQFHVIGLTASDISTTKYDDFAAGKVKEPAWKYEDWGVMGLGEMPGISCVVSTFRLKFDKPGEEKLRTRLRKVVCHELGHNLGLPHCPDPKCFMADAAETVKTVDVVEESLCAACLAKIRR